MQAVAWLGVLETVDLIQKIEIWPHKIIGLNTYVHIHSNTNPKLSLMSFLYSVGMVCRRWRKSVMDQTLETTHVRTYWAARESFAASFNSEYCQISHQDNWSTKVF